MSLCVCVWLAVVLFAEIGNSYHLDSVRMTFNMEHERQYYWEASAFRMVVTAIPIWMPQNGVNSSDIFCYVNLYFYLFF